MIRAGRLPPIAVVLAAWAVVLVSAWPGLMSIDANAQLLQARDAFYDDTYPPAMAAVWRVLDGVVAGPALVFLLQTGLLVWGAYGASRTALAPQPAAYVTALVAIFPPVLAPMRVVWSDAVLAGALMAGYALVAHGIAAALAATTARGRWLGGAAAVVGAVMLGLGTAVRHNGFVAMTPLVVALALGAGPRAWSRWRRVLLGIVAAAVIAASATAGNRALIDRHVHVWHERNAVMDLVGTLRYGGRQSHDELLRRLDGLPVVTTDLPACIARKSRWSWWHLTNGDDRVMDPPSTPAQRVAVERALRQAILDDPGSYLMHRSVVFAAVVGLVPSPPAMVPGGKPLPGDVFVATGIDPPARRVSTFTDVLRALGRVPLFRPVVYLVLAVVGLIVARRRRWPVAAVALMASGVAHELALFAIAPSADFRYSHWLIVCVALAWAMAVAGRLAAQNARRP